MIPQDLLSFLPLPPLEELAKFQAAINTGNQLNAVNSTRAQVNTDQAKMQALETQNAQLVLQLNNMNVAMEALNVERNALKEQLAATEAAKLGIEKQYAELTGQRKVMRKIVAGAMEDDRRIWEKHAKQIEDKDLKIQTLETQLAASQEERKNMKLLNQQGLMEVSQKALQKKETLGQEKKEVVSEPTTQLHTELGKLYVELQEAKKPQEALMAQLAAKDKEIENLTKQYDAKLTAKDLEIQKKTFYRILKEVIQGGDEMNENVMAKDPEVEATRDGQSE
ncbi:hypothetical protein CRE_01308 [Caenorhabditis remanei]|uniref:Uncharacterized protein n=1 Tax=Caenorhabditis remanei TaxID=31234 RepID=E3N9L3_CAERE|nr:hypothetical protein CRE_01308 [Caenorhabditis remanei]